MSDPRRYQLEALRRVEAGDFAGAHAMLASALKLRRGDPEILTAIGAVWRRAGNPAEAVAVFDAMIAHGIEHAPAWLERGHALLEQNAYGPAAASYRRAATLDPGSADSFAGAATATAELGDWPAARTEAAGALALEPGNPIAHNVLALADLEDRRFEPARARLEALRQRCDETEPALVETLTLLGDAYHGLGTIDAAFAGYADAQAVYRRRLAPRFGDERRGQHALIAHVQAGLDRAPAVPWRPLPPDTTPGASHSHVFLLGYPRSGTTLVENMLASLPGVVAIEEKPTLAATEGPILHTADGIARLGDLSPADAAHFRTAYWQSVASHAGDVTGKTLIDMNPMRGISLPIIARLFPDARILVMRRDPRDVVWSCFRRHFAVTPTGYAFSDLEGAAHHYAALMTLIQACLDRLPLHAHVLRYEALVSNFDGTTKAVCDFLEVEWDDAVRGFDATARRRGVTTASGRQIRKGLFNGAGQWRAYRDHLAPILPILAPWVERFGYEP